MKAQAYSTLRETFTAAETLTAAEDCQILELLEVSQATSQEMVSQPPKKKKKTALELLIGEDDDDSSHSSRGFLSEEFDNYLKLNPLKSCDNCLEWWSHNSLQFPNLAKLAKKIFMCTCHICSISYQ